MFQHLCCEFVQGPKDGRHFAYGCTMYGILIPKHFGLRVATDKISGSDVQPCVWAIVESCTAIFCACLPTFPALFHMKTVREIQRPGSDSKGNPSWTQVEHRLHFSDSATNSRREFFYLGDRADTPSMDKESASSHANEDTESVWGVGYSWTESLWQGWKVIPAHDFTIILKAYL